MVEQVKKKALDLSLSELIDKYSEYMVRITFKDDGSVDVWICSKWENLEG